MSWSSINYNNPSSPLPTSPSLKSYTLSIPPQTDIWRPDSTKDVWSAPIVYRTIASSQTFKSARLTVSAAWKTQYDQGGLILFWPGEPGRDRKTQRWVKAGVEFFEGVPMVGVVGCDRFADWSLSPVPSARGDGGVGGASEVSLSLEAERKGTTLWIYALGADGRRVQALREVKWAFLEDREDGELAVGIYGAKPTPDAGDADAELRVRFSDVVIEETVGE